MTYRLLSLMTIASAIIISGLIWGGYGILGSCLTVFFTVPVWSSVYMNTKPLSKKQFRADVISFVSEGFWRIVILVLLHLAVAFLIGRRTMLPDTSVLYFVFGFMGYAYAYFRKNKSKLYWYGLGLFPSVLSVFLVLNYILSFNSQEETYAFTNHTAMQVSKMEGETFIIGYRITLENRAYSDYPGIRSFLDDSDVKGNRITYTFKTGIFGIRVVSKREFSRVKKTRKDA